MGDTSIQARNARDNERALGRVINEIVARDHFLVVAVPFGAELANPESEKGFG